MYTPNISSINPFSYIHASSFSLEKIQGLYLNFLNYFPAQAQPVVSIIMIALIVYSVYRVIRKDFIFIIAVIILFPASIPVLKSIWWGVVAFVKFLWNLV